MARLTVDGKTYNFDFDHLLNVELIAIEDQVGWTLNEWSTALEKGSVKALTAAVWILRRREEPGLPFDAVQFEVGNLETEDDPKETPDEPSADAEPSGSVTSTSSPVGAESHQLRSIG